MFPCNQQNSSKKFFIIVLWVKSRRRNMIWSQFRKMIGNVLIGWNKIDIVYSNIIKHGFSQQKTHINQWSTIKPVNRQKLTYHGQGCSGAGTRRNAVPANIFEPERRSADAAAFRQVNSYYKKLPYTRNLANWFSEKSLKLLPPDDIILSLKCTKFDFGWGSAPDPAGGAYSAPLELLAGFLKRILLLREGKENKERDEFICAA